MKIAKKVLAVVMALAMIAGLSAMAFAAEGSYVLTSTTDDEYLVVTVTLKNGAGVEADKFTVEYDPAVLKIADPDLDVANGKDVEDMNNVANNTIMGQPNATEEGKVVFGYAFSEKLTADYLKASRGKTVNIDPNDFEFVVLYFTVLDEDAATTIKVSGEAYKGSSLKVGNDKGTEVTPVPSESTTAEEGTKPVNPGTGDKDTGDNMALAAAAGVALLAGAAFIVSKKRK